LTQVQSVNAQSPDWIRIAPTDERFQVLMPQQPKVELVDINYVSGDVTRTAKGKAYISSADESTYMIWSLATFRTPSNRVDVIATFLDEYADLVWESLLKPARDALPKTAAVEMSYKSELSIRVIPGREYFLRLGDAFGATRFYVDGEHLYVLVALTSGGNSAVAQNLFSGFLANSNETPFLPVTVPVEEKPYDQVFKASETTTRAKVVSKPEPQYTEAARKYRVTGMVALSGVISTDGRIVSIHVEKRLPHGLTEASIAAAQRVRFTPATRDGQAVFQSVQLEYNFNLY